MHTRAFSVLLISLLCCLFVANGVKLKNFNFPNFLIDVYINSARSFWKGNDMDPIVVKKYSKEFNNDYADADKVLTIAMLTEKHVLRGLTNVVRAGNTSLSYSSSSIDLEFNCTIMYLRWYFNYAIHFTEHNSNSSWISVGKKEHYILGPVVQLRFSIDVKSRNITLKKLSVQKDFLVSEGMQAAVGRNDTPVPRMNETRFAMDFRSVPGKEFVRGFIKKEFKYIVRKYIEALMDAVL